MKKLLFLSICITILCSTAYSQWNANFSGYNSGDAGTLNTKGKDVDKDGTGGCYVTGYVTNAATGTDMILVKYNSSGDTVWSRSFNGSANGDDQALSSAVDVYGNIYVTGYATMSGTGTEMVLLKYNSFGTLLWQVSYGATTNNTDDKALGICVDAASNCYITGFTTDANGYTDATTIKYDPAGNKVWVQTENGGPDSKGLGIAVDNESNCYITGYTTSAAAGKDMLAIKYKSDGSKLWDFSLNGEADGDDQSNGIGIDASGNVYITGYVTTNNSNNDCALVKLSSAGTQQWIRTYNGSGNAEDRGLGIAVDQADGCIYLTGHTAGITGGNDYLTLKYNSEGTQLWQALYNGTGSGDDQAYAVILTKTLGITTSVVVTGGSWGTYNNHDFATVKYSPSNGSLISVTRYSNTSSTDDQAINMSYDPLFNRIFVTGSSILTGDSHSSSIISTQMIPSENSSELTAQGQIPSDFNLYQNYPNPFNPSTSIKFDISKNAKVKLSVYDMLGKEVSVLVNQDLNAGKYNISFNMSNLSSGIYFYELKTAEFIAIKKMTLIK